MVEDKKRQLVEKVNGAVQGEVRRQYRDLRSREVTPDDAREIVRRAVDDVNVTSISKEEEKGK